MPIGIICNVLAVAIGGALGSIAGNRLSESFKTKLNLIFSVCSMSIGVGSIILMKNMPAVILSVILGTIIGIVFKLQSRFEVAGKLMQKGISKIVPVSNFSEEQTALLVTTVVLFCTSGTGIYGSIVSGMSGDHSILIAKSILDIFTALIFACTLGPVTSVIAIPQLIVFLSLYFCAKLIFPLTTPAMVDDFKAVGGIIMLANGFRIAKMKDYPVADMVPAMIIVWPISWAWAQWIVPLLTV